MYEINGVEVTYEDLLGKAEELGLTFDELLKRNPSIKSKSVESSNNIIQQFVSIDTEPEKKQAKEDLVAYIEPSLINNDNNTQTQVLFDPLIVNKEFERGIFKESERKDFNEYTKKENVDKRKKIQADQILNDLTYSLNNIPQKTIKEATANNYFKINERPVTVVNDSNIEPDFYETLSFKEYREKGLKEGFLTEEESKFYESSGSKRVGFKYIPIKNYLSDKKFKQYENYLKTGVIDEEYNPELEYVKNNTINELQEKEIKLFLRTVPEDSQSIISPFGKDKKYKSAEEAIEALKIGKNIIKEQNNNLKNNYNLYIKQAKPFIDNINRIDSDIEDIIKSIPSGNIENGTEDQIKKYQVLAAESQEVQRQFEEKGLDTIYSDLIDQQKLNDLNIKQFNEDAREVETSKIIENALALDYTLSARTGMALEEFFGGGVQSFLSLTGQGLLKVVKPLYKPEARDKINQAIDYLQQSTVDYNLKLAKKRETTIPENITLNDIENKNINFFDWFGESLANNSPSIVTAFIPGGAVLTKSLNLIKAGTRTAQGIFFVGETGLKFGDIEVREFNALEQLPKLKKQIEEELDNDKKRELQEEYNDLEKISNYSFAQKAFTSYAFGGAATVAETLGTLRLLNGASSLAKKIGTQEFKAKAYSSPLNFAANVTGKTISGISKNALKAISIEEAEEILTQVAHNIIDISVLDEDKSIIEGIDKEFLANVAVTSFAIMAPKTMGNTRNLIKSEFATREEVLENEKDVIELIQLQEQFRALGPGPEKTGLRERRRELLDKLAFQDATSLTKLNSMTNEEIIEAADIARQMRQLRFNMSRLGQTGEISPVVTESRKKIEQQYNNLNTRREYLLNKRSRENKNKIKDLREEMGENFVNLNPDYYFGLYDFYKDAAMVLMPKNGKFIVVDTKNPKWRESLENLSEQELAAVDELVESKNNAAAVGNNIIINEEVVNEQIAKSGLLSQAGYAAAAPIEELFHIQNKAKNIVDKDGILSDEATKAVDEAIETIRNKFKLGKITEQNYNDLIARFNSYKTGGKGKVILKSGKRGKATADSEELLAQINNAIAIGALNMSDFNSIPSLKYLINGISKDIFGDSSWMFDLKTSNDVFNFIKNYQSNIQNKTYLALPDDEDNVVKFSKKEDNKTIKQIFDKFTGPAENRKFKSKEEFKNSPEFFDALLEIEQSNTLDASIRNTVSEAYLDMNPGFVKEVKEKISDKYRSEYDASKNSLFGWLTGKNISGQPLINLVSGDIQIKRGKKPSTVATTKKVGGEDSKVTVAETLVSDEISPEDYADIKLAQDKLKKNKPQQSAIANKIGLTENELNLAKREIINFLRKTDRPAMTDPKKFFKALVDYTTGKGVQPGGFANVIYDKLSLPKNGELSTKNRESFIRKIAEDLIALNKVDPSVMRRSKWTPFYELEIKNMNPTQMQKAIDEGRIPSTSNLKSGLDLFKTLDPSIDQITEYLMNIRPDVLKRKMPKFLAEVIVKNEFNDIVNNTTQPVYDTKGNVTNKTIDLSETVTEQEVKRGAPQVREKIARPEGIKFNKAVENIENLTVQVNPEFEGEIKNIDQLLNTYIGDKIYKHDTKKAIDDFFTDVENIWAPVLPKDLITATVLRPSNRILAKKGKIKIKVDGVETTTDKYFVNKRDNFLKNKKIKYGKPFTGKAKDYKYGITYSKYFGSTPEEISKTNTKGKTRGKGENKITQNIKQINAMHLSMHKQLWQRVFKSIRENNKNAKAWGNYFSLVGVDVTHPHRMGAEMLGWSKNPKGYDGKLYEWEHAMPATRAYLYLLIGALDTNFSKSDFNTMYDLVMKNYKLIALDNYDDKIKIKSAGRTTSMGENWSIVNDNWFDRYFDEIVANIEGGIDPFSIEGLDNKTFGETLEIDASGNLTTPSLSRSVNKAKDSNIKTLSNNVIKFSKSETNNEIIGYAKTVDEALSVARNPNAPVKKIRVFDFDDTLATTKSDVLFTAPDGTKGKLNAEEFAKDGSRLLKEGYVFDFSEFNKVTEGKPGPLLDIAKKIQEARGTEDVFVLTARAPEAQVAIKEFLDSVGLNIPLKNITGLGNSTGAAKAKWIVNKAAEGYNDFYFADDAYQNVKAVQDALSQLDVKSKVQQAKIKFSKSVNEDFNKIIEQTTGIASEKRYSRAKAKVRGAGKGNKKFFIPYSAEDFMGLLYPLLSKGKLGDSQMAWFKEHLLDPYARAMENVSRSRINLLQDFKALKKALEIPKNLRKNNDSGFTNEQAVRVYLFNKTGNLAPGLSKTDTQELLDVVNSDGLLKAFADEILNLTKGDGYAKPGNDWLAGTITTDLLDVLNNVKRAKYLDQSGFTKNAELIFSEENLNKLEAAYGEKYRDAMENILKRMKSGKNRLFSGNRLSNRVLDYINGSIGAIMFFNTRSAVLQIISNINFLNWSFNNPIKAGKAFANQPQYWKDFMKLMNSDYLVDRRNGLKININENEIADAAATSKNKAKAAMSYILQKGFLPTQFADSFAIASGGATFYRNRINDLIKNEGLTEAEAKKKAMLEFRQVAETSQQSSDPSKISAQQASDLGRVVLAFNNTPMQYARLQKRAIQDLINRRGDAKTNVSRIIYYGVVQNLIFNALQQALFALGAGDDEDEMSNEEKEKYEKTKQKKYMSIANGMLDSLLRGLGVAGLSTSVVKNFLMDVYERSGRKRPEYVDAVYKLIQISPPISSKISKVRQAAYQFDSKKRREEIFEKGFSIDNPAYEAASKVISATTNLPLDRLYNKANNIEAALAEDTEAWQTIAMLAGWPEWQIKPDKKDKKVLTPETIKINNSLYRESTGAKAVFK